MARKLLFSCTSLVFLINKTSEYEHILRSRSVVKYEKLICDFFPSSSANNFKPIYSSIAQEVFCCSHYDDERTALLLMTTMIWVLFFICWKIYSFPWNGKCLLHTARKATRAWKRWTTEASWEHSSSLNFISSASSHSIPTMLPHTLYCLLALSMIYVARIDESWDDLYVDSARWKWVMCEWVNLSHHDIPHSLSHRWFSSRNSSSSSS